MSGLRLYSYWRSSSSWRVRIALAYKNLPYEYVAVHLLRDGGEQHGPEHRARNPMEQVPLLEVEEAGRTRRIAQSLAIVEYLDERYPEPPLLPGSAWERATARAMAEVVNAGIQPYQNLAVLQHVKRTYGGEPNAWAGRWIALGLGALEATAVDTAGRFLVGDRVSVADVCLVPQLYAARRMGVELGAFPTLVRVEAECLGVEAFQVAHPDRQPDAAP